MASRGIKIKDVVVKTELDGDEKIPVSDGTGAAKVVTINTVKGYIDEFNVNITQAEYDVLVAEGKVKENVTYNIYDE